MIEIKQTFDLCDIQRLRNQKSIIFTFRQSLFKAYIQRRRAFFVSNTLQESITNTDIIASLSTDRFPILSIETLNKENTFDDYDKMVIFKI